MPNPNETPETEPQNVLDAVLATIEVTPDEVDSPVEAEAPEVVEEVEPQKTIVEPKEEDVVEDVKSEAEKAVDDEMQALGIDKEASQKRFRELANDAREGREYRQRFEEQDKVFQHMESAGITGEQFGIMTAIASDVNSGDPMRQERAFSALQAELTALAKALGREAPGFDPLDQYADLKEKVETTELDRATALELAQSRARTKLHETHSRTTNEQAERQRAVTDGQSALNELEATLEASDVHYAAKRAAVVAILKPQIPNISPDKWAQTYAEVYRTIPNPQPAAAAIRKPASDNPSRPNGAGGSAVPKSMQDAVLMSLGMQPD